MNSTGYSQAFIDKMSYEASKGVLSSATKHGTLRNGNNTLHVGSKPLINQIRQPNKTTWLYHGTTFILNHTYLVANEAC